MTDGKVPQDEGIKQTKQREVRTCAEPEYDEYDKRESRRTPQLATCVTNVVHHVLVRQTEDVECSVRGHGYVLMTVHREGFWSAGDGSTEIHLPQQLSVTRIQRKEMTFAPSREEQIRRGREDAALGVVNHLELPLLLAG